MKTRIILSLIAAFLLQFTAVRADGFTDGLMKLMNSEAISTFSTKMFDQLAMAPNANADYMRNQFKTDAVEWMAKHYRKNMSEKDFNDMVSFFMQPEVLAVQKKVVSAATIGQGQEMMQALMPQMMTIMQGGTPEDLKMPDCDAKLKESFLHWLEINGTSETMKTSLGVVKSKVADMSPAGMSQEQKQQAAKMMNGLFAFMEKNIDALLVTSMVGKVDIKDMEVLNAIENKPFFVSYKKTNLSLAGDMSTFMDKLMAGLKKQ